MDTEKLKFDLIEQLKSELKQTNTEKEMMYKVFFDMKKDVTELKRMFVEILQDELSVEEPLSKQIGEAKPVCQDDQDKLFTYPNGDIIPVQQLEKEAMIYSLKRYKGNRKNASEALGISERTLYRKMKEYDIED